MENILQNDDRPFRRLTSLSFLFDRLMTEIGEDTQEIIAGKDLEFQIESQLVNFSTFISQPAQFFSKLGGQVSTERTIHTFYRVRHTFQGFTECSDNPPSPPKNPINTIGYPIFIAEAE